VMEQPSISSGDVVWTTLPTDVVAANSLSTFRQLLKRFIFKQTYPDISYTDIRR